MNKEIYHIKNLKCQYKTSPFPVLEIDELKIQEKSIVFFIGSSGVGKSTILETLGLMNNTIDNNVQDTIFNFSLNGYNENLMTFWKKKERDIAKFRKKHLSFIFQSTNLFTTLSTYDNTIITSLLQGKSKAEAHQSAKEIFSKIFPELKEDKNVTELSGGQRQRIAFARAIVAEYSILFADEPTGNLDYGTADLLMNELINIIRKNNKTAIIVSHDINLAIKYADKIVLIEKKINDYSDRKFNYGKISENSVYHKHSEKKWINNQNNLFEDKEMLSYLTELLISNTKN